MRRTLEKEQLRLITAKLPFLSGQKLLSITQGPAWKVLIDRDLHSDTYSVIGCLLCAPTLQFIPMAEIQQLSRSVTSCSLTRISRPCRKSRRDSRNQHCLYRPENLVRILIEKGCQSGHPTGHMKPNRFRECHHRANIHAAADQSTTSNRFQTIMHHPSCCPIKNGHRTCCYHSTHTWSAGTSQPHPLQRALSNPSCCSRAS